jgi:hypothetical protein
VLAELPSEERAAVTSLSAGTSAMTVTVRAAFIVAAGEVSG